MARARKRSRGVGRLVLGLSLVGLVCCSDTAPDGTAPRAGPERNRAVVAFERADPLFRARELEIRGLVRREQIELVFLGDSITQRWESEGRYAWNRYYAPRGAANFGIDGDRTQELLWRVRSGDFEGMNPKGIALLIGTNNTFENSAEEIAEGVAAVIAELRGRMPGTRILLLGLLPRHPLRESPIRLKIERTNTLLRAMADGRGVRYADFGPVFTTSDGSIRADLMPDFLHPGPRGYARWAAAMEDELSSLLAGRQP